MKLSKRILAIGLIIAFIFLAFSLNSVNFDYLKHCCSHTKDCTVCAMYSFVQNFNTVILVNVVMLVFAIYVKNKRKKYRYNNFKLLPVELKVRIND